MEPNPENFFALIDGLGQVAKLISYDEKAGVFERIDGNWSKMVSLDTSYNGMRVVFVNPEIIELYDEMYNSAEPLKENDLKTYNTEALVESKKAGK
jgi:hypothetical protein